MRASTTRLIGMLASGLLVISAVEPIGTITAPEAIKISGVNVPATAASSMPFGVGDQLTTTDSAALIRFDERGVVTLAKHSSVRIQAQGDQTVVCLVDGSYHYKFVPNSKLTVCKEDKLLATNLEGDISMGISKKIPIIVAAAGGGAALIAGVAKPKSQKCPAPDGSGQGHGDGHDCSVQ